VWIQVRETLRLNTLWQPEAAIIRPDAPLPLWAVLSSRVPLPPCLQIVKQPETVGNSVEPVAF
jgi:hypothetical protein